MNASSVLVLLMASFFQVGAAPTDPTSMSDPKLPGRIHPLYEYDIPISAEVEGLLTRVTVTDGSRVKKGDILAAIDERHAQVAVKVSQRALDVHRKRAEDDIEERYASKAADVAKADYDSDMEANSGGNQVVSPIQIKKKKLDWERSLLQIEKAQKDQVIYGLEADGKEAELEAAQLALDRRQIRAPWDGEVQRLIRHESEWVNPGDPVLHLVRYDVLQIVSQVRSTEFDPVELQGRPVTVVVTLARDRKVSVPGRVVHVDQSVVEAKDYGWYWVRAEIQNQREGDFWLVRPGLPAEMTIHISQPPVEAARQPDAAAAR